MFVDELMVQYAEALCTASRTDPRVDVGLGPEQAARLIEAAKAIATAQARSYVTPPDIKTAFRAYPQVESVADELAAVIAQRLALTENPEASEAIDARGRELVESPMHRFAGKRIAVVMGGLSAEREVSLDTGAGVVKALQDKQWDVVAIDWKPGTSLARMLEEANAAAVWNALHGTYGEDGAIQGLCTCMQIACTGSGILASALAMDKVMAKRIFESIGVPTPRWRLLAHDAADNDLAALADMPLPFVVKPAYEGSSVGVSIVEDRGELPAALAEARRFHGPVLVEDYIAGTEVFVGILDDRVLGSVEVRPATKFYDYEAKYKRTDTQYLIPPELPRDVIAQAEHHALAAYRALGCSGHARPDLRISRANEPFVLEVNTLPGMTAKSLLPKIARSVGMDYATLCEEILASAR